MIRIFKEILLQFCEMMNKINEELADCMQVRIALPAPS